MLIQDSLPALLIDFFSEENFVVVEIFFLAQELLELGCIGHVLDILFLDRKLRPLHRLVVIKGLLDLVRSGTEGIDGQQVMGDMVMEAACIEVYVELVVVLLKELTSNL